MTKRLKETLVGVFVVFGVIIFIVLYIWLSRKMFFSNTYDVRVQFEDVDGLRVGDPVFVFGLEKGKVKSLRIESGRVNVILAIDRDVILPEGTQITVRSLSYIGADKYVKITPGHGDRIPEVHYGSGGSFELEALAGQIDSLVMKFGSIELPDLDAAARRLSADLNRSIERLLKMIEGPVGKIDTLASRMDSLAILLQGEGAIGQMLRSDELYQELRETNSALKALIQDINDNPKKYINIRVF
ncbi:MCE family protein [candidate division WOR-3 bacterium]|nr:MCE family protein [candidate division WOR-3 bacterium]